ncbi:uncharacterized protein LOC118203339 [Stegodyphus dumicola]|uniref:uncharacterized protein LOC118203339 n=1 Tax=Stegodyphus dumicola TaxID=202533 RepID=UPI0015B2D2D4|nr:uncharacterized protein LOC118203339 [Stegodyphus dumicola]
MQDLTKNHILGATIADIHVIEFQKRGLPHMHLLLFLAEEDKIRDAECIDSLVCAELPDATRHPELHNIVKSSMIHGPCGELNRNSPCMSDGVCSKGFPKPFQAETKENVYFAESEERNAFQRAAEKNTMLTGWFELNRTVPEANGYLYAEIPKHFTWRNHAWQTRVRLGDYIISRMYSVSPKDVERFHLRLLLLCHVKGAKSFADLRTYEEDSFSLALRSIEDQLEVHNVSLCSLGLPQPTLTDAVSLEVPQFDVQYENEQAEVLNGMLNPEQKLVYDSVLEAVRDENPNTPKTFCVNAFAGAGKTFLFRTILHAVRGMGHVAIPVAWTGIAAVLLTGGRTVHSTFKLPVPLLETSSCRVRQDSAEGRYLKTAKLFIWDECTMTPHYALEAVDRLLRDLTGLDVPFGGKTLVLGGDWRQTLPVVPHGNRTSAIESCLRNSFLWPHFKQCTLSTNMRLNPEEQEFSEWLLQLGDGRLRNDSGLDEDVIEIPSLCVVNRSIVEEMFGCGNEFDLQDLASFISVCDCLD